MVKVTYVEHDDTRHDVQLTVGTNLMQGAVSNAIPGIRGDCGGACACATCHVYIDNAWQSLMPPVSEYESEMLECAVGQTDQSRLGCQIPVSETLEGLVIRMPVSQV